MAQPKVMLGALFVVGSLAIPFIAGCEQKKRSDDVYRFVEYVRLEGECFEDHVKRPARYVGEIVHWHNTTKNTHSRYGSVHHWDSTKPEALTARIQDPYSYKPPFTVSFDDLRAEEIAGTTLRLKGISKHLGNEENSSGPSYWTTCDVRVLERLDHIPRKESAGQGGDSRRRK